MAGIRLRSDPRAPTSVGRSQQNSLSGTAGPGAAGAGPEVTAQAVVETPDPKLAATLAQRWELPQRQAGLTVLTEVGPVDIGYPRPGR